MMNTVQRDGNAQCGARRNINGCCCSADRDQRSRQAVRNDAGAQGRRLHADAPQHPRPPRAERRGQVDPHQGPVRPVPADRRRDHRHGQAPRHARGGGRDGLHPPGPRPRRGDERRGERRARDLLPATRGLHRLEVRQPQGSTSTPTFSSPISRAPSARSSRSPAPCRPTRRSSSSTSRPPRSLRRIRRASSTSCATCAIATVDSSTSPTASTRCSRSRIR